MYSQYNFEHQARARQQDLRGHSPYAANVRIPAGTGRIAAAKPKVLLFLAAAAPAIAAIALLVAAR